MTSLSQISAVDHSSTTRHLIITIIIIFFFNLVVRPTGPVLCLFSGKVCTSVSFLEGSSWNPWTAPISLYQLAWPRCSLLRHRTAGLHPTGQVPQPTRRWAHSGSLQVRTRTQGQRSQRLESNISWSCDSAAEDNNIRSTASGSVSNTGKYYKRLKSWFHVNSFFMLTFITYSFQKNRKNVLSSFVLVLIKKVLTKQIQQHSMRNLS